MRFRAFAGLLLIAAMILSLTACVAKLPVEELIPGTGEAPISTAPVTTAAPEPSLPAPKGVDSVKTLLELSLDYFHSGCDYSKIAEYHDPVAYLAYFIMEDFYRDEELSFAQAREKAALLYTDAETFRAKDPKLAEMVMEEMDAEDPEEALAEYMNHLREGFRNGDITEENPNYEKFSALLTDWDKGADYIFEHYPELMEDAAARGAVFGLEGAMDAMRRFARFELYRSEREDEIFRELECEYRPENSYVDDSGVCSYDMGSVITGNESWGVDLSRHGLPDDDWRGGGDAAGVKLSSFEVVDAILLALGDKQRYPALKRVLVTGFSAGGQFVGRYVAVGKGFVREGVEVGYAAMAP